MPTPKPLAQHGGRVGAETAGRKQKDVGQVHPHTF
jgi:hypothetical protein